MTDFKKKSTRFTEEMNRALIDGYTKKQVSISSVLSLSKSCYPELKTHEDVQFHFDWIIGCSEVKVL